MVKNRARRAEFQSPSSARVVWPGRITGGKRLNFFQWRFHINPYPNPWRKAPILRSQDLPHSSFSSFPIRMREDQTLRESGIVQVIIGCFQINQSKTAVFFWTSRIISSTYKTDLLGTKSFALDYPDQQSQKICIAWERTLSLTKPDNPIVPHPIRTRKDEYIFRCCNLFI